MKTYNFNPTSPWHSVDDILCYHFKRDEVCDPNDVYYKIKKILSIRIPTFHDGFHLKQMDVGRSDAQPVADYHWEMYKLEKQQAFLMIECFYVNNEYRTTSYSYKGLFFYDEGQNGGLLRGLSVTLLPFGVVGAADAKFFTDLIHVVEKELKIVLV